VERRDTHQPPLADGGFSRRTILRAATDFAVRTQGTAERHMPRRSRRFLPRLRRGARWAQRKLASAPPAVRVAALLAVPIPVVALTNLVYHVVHKPTELFVFIGNGLDKEPGETWRQYGPLFRAYSTSTVTPELLAALAQVESSGNPVARTYWRWRLSSNPLAV